MMKKVFCLKMAYIRYKEDRGGFVDMQSQKNLALGFSAGSRAIENYDACCKLFGFKSAMRGNFAPQKRLYAKNATIEGFNVWMIAHSNFSEPFNNNGKWYNIIEGELIKEVWFVANELLEAPNERAFRVSFVKKYGKYIFQGVYAQQKIEWETMPNGKRELVRIFRRISETYPITSGDSIELPEISNIDDIGEKRKELACVTEKCEIKARIIEKNIETTVMVDIVARPFQKELVGKKQGERFKLPKIELTYEIRKIFASK